MGLGHLVIEGFVGDGGTKKGIEATVEIGDGLDPLAGTDCRQRQTQAKGRDDALTATKLHVFATGIEQRFGKTPLECSDQISCLRLGDSSWYPKPHTKKISERITRNPQKIKYLKVHTYEDEDKCCTSV